jgi:hypothetical protein
LIEFSCAGALIEQTKSANIVRIEIKILFFICHSFFLTLKKSTNPLATTRRLVRVLSLDPMLTSFLLKAIHKITTETSAQLFSNGVIGAFYYEFVWTIQR